MLAGHKLLLGETGGRVPLRLEDFVLISTEAVAFTPGRELPFRPPAIVSAVNAAFPDRYFHMEAVSQPLAEIPTQGKVDITIGEPFVRLTSENQQFKYEAKSGRTSSEWRRVLGQEEPVSVRTASDQALDALLVSPVLEGVQIGRLALVAKRWAPSTQPGVMVSTAFCRPDLVDKENPLAPFRNSQSFRIDNLKKYASGIGDLMVNSWVRVQCAKVGDQNGVLVENDINTFSEDASTRRIERNTIEEFFQWASEESDRILRLYFPT